MLRSISASAIALAALGLGACNGTVVSPDTGNRMSDTAAEAQSARESADNALATAPADDSETSADPVHLTRKNDQIDLDYAIPAQAAAIPSLRDLLLQKAKSEESDLLDQRKDQVAEASGNYTVPPYGLTSDWQVVADTAQLLVLVDKGYRYIGGAHGSDVFEALIWDKAGNHRIALANLFTDKAKALATIRKPFCDTLDKERAKRRGAQGIPNDGTSFTACPGFDEPITLAPAKVVGGKFGRIGVWIPADIAGAHAEGNYTYELFIPEEMIPLVREKWRPSFPG